MGVLLGLASSVAYGLSDFLGGLLSRRASFVRVALLGQVGGLVTLTLVAPLTPTAVLVPTALAWGGLSGIGTGMAMMFLFRGMSRGAMSVVVPVSAVGGVALPVHARATSAPASISAPRSPRRWPVSHSCATCSRPEPS